MLSKGTYVVCDPAIVYPTKIDWDDVVNPLIHENENFSFSTPFGSKIWTFRTFSSRFIVNKFNTVIESKTGFISVIPVEDVLVEDIYTQKELFSLRDVYVFTATEDFTVDYVNDLHVRIDDAVLTPEESMDSDWDSVNLDF